MKSIYPLSLSLLTVISATLAKETPSTQRDRSGLAVTIYNQDLALVRDTRHVTLPLGVQVLALKDVSARIRPETLSLNAQGLTLLEQNFEYDLIDLNALINKNIGQTVTIVSSNYDGDKTLQKGKILANNDQPIVEIDGQISTLPKDAQIVFDKLPSNLRDRPTMTLMLNNEHNGKQTLDVTYLTGGLSWQADYVASLVDEKNLSLSGWITLKNQSGTTYTDATLQLVAGDVNTVREQMMPNVVKMRAKTQAYVNDVTEEALFEYHLYTLPRKTTINDNQQKQVAFRSSNQASYQKRYIVDSRPVSYHDQFSGENKLAVNTYVEFKNDKSSGLGLPLPKGIIRTYQKDSQGNAQFIGEDRIQHTPQNETVKLRLGESFDLTVNIKQTKYKNHGKTVELAYEVKLKNAKDTAVEIEFPQVFSGNWDISNASHDWQKTDSRTATWTLTVPVKDETVLTYKVNISP